MNVCRSLSLFFQIIQKLFDSFERFNVFYLYHSSLYLIPFSWFSYFTEMIDCIIYIVPKLAPPIAIEGNFSKSRLDELMEFLNLRFVFVFWKRKLQHPITIGKLIFRKFGCVLYSRFKHNNGGSQSQITTQSISE